MPGLTDVVILRTADCGETDPVSDGHREHGLPVGREPAARDHDMRRPGRLPLHEQPPGFSVDDGLEPSETGRTPPRAAAVADLLPLIPQPQN